jgi:hypothetical protein
MEVQDDMYHLLGGDDTWQGVRNIRLHRETENAARREGDAAYGKGGDGR